MRTCSKLLLLLLLLFVLDTSHASTCRAAWRWYKSCLRQRPLLTKSSTSSVIMAVSDVLCQRLERSRAHDDDDDDDDNVLPGREGSSSPGDESGGPRSRSGRANNDWRRTGHVAVTGFTMSGPISHGWYALLEAVVSIQDRRLGVAARMVLDAFVFSPVTVAAYFIWRAVLEGEGPGGIATKLRANWTDALAASLTFWPLANIINFGFVPVELRVLYNNMLSLFWTGYLSHMNATHMKKEGNALVQ